MKKIFLSFNGLLILLRSGQITVEDLEGALFCFGCASGAIFPPDGSTPSDVLRNFEHDPERGTVILSAIQECLLDAASDFRVKYVPDDTLQYSRLNELLERNGYNRVSREGEYSYPEAARRISEANPGLDPWYKTRP